MRSHVSLHSPQEVELVKVREKLQPSQRDALGLTFLMKNPGVYVYCYPLTGEDDQHFRLPLPSMA